MGIELIKKNGNITLTAPAVNNTVDLSDYATIDYVDAELANKLDTNVGANNSGAFMMVDSSGKVRPMFYDIDIYTDDTLTMENMAADAKAVGEALEELENKVPSVEGLASTVYVDSAIETIELTPGPQGPQGEKGEPGNDGYTPVKGVDYFDGAQGPQGIQGEQGPKGDKGDTGPQGLQGIQGEKGDTGAQGEKGEQGEPGKDGRIVYYISPDGNDSDDGLTVNTPKKTVAACIKIGAKYISAKRGIYKEQVSIANIEEFELFPTDNNQTYDVNTGWEPIIFDLSDTLDIGNLEDYNAIKKIPYTNNSNEQFDKVFTKQSQAGVIGTGYNATVWLMSNDETVCIKLKPVLTVAEVEAEANTFTWVDSYIYINANFDGVENIKVPVNWDSGFRIANVGKVNLREVEVRYSGSYNIWILNCPYFDFYKVSAKYSSYGSGIDIDNANGKLISCYATKNYDGFGVSGYGHTTYIDCVSEFNTDDGVSHHNGTSGTFIGGRYEGNGKGGNTPAYGANVNIYGGIYKNNKSFGIGYLYTSGKNPTNGIVQGALIVGNETGLKVDANCNVVAVNCLYKDNNTDKNSLGNLTEYNMDTCNCDNSEDTGVKNWLLETVGSDGQPYYGDNGEVGYRVGYRVSSSGTEKAQATTCCTGFIPVVPGNVIRVKNITLESSGYSNITFFNSSFAIKTTYTINSSNMVLDENGIMTITVPGTEIVYMRITTGVINENTIITKDEEI